MSHVNIFKIKILEPNFYQPCLQNTRRASTPKKSPKPKNYEAKTRDFVNHKLNKGQSLYLKANTDNTVKNKKQLQTLETCKSTTSSYQSHRIMKKQIFDTPIETKQKLERPQSAMLKKSRKRSWQVYNTKVQTFLIEDIIFKTDQVFIPQSLEDCVVFFKKKMIFARLTQDKMNMEWEPITNQYVVKIFGRVNINDKTYFIVQNLLKSSIRDLIDSFGPYKQSLVKIQIRKLIEGLIHCHSRGIIHNRINPETIYMNKQGSLLIDVVKSSGRLPSKIQKHRYYHYFAPELLIKEMVTESCDVWAVGCLTLEMLTGNVLTSHHHPYNEICKASPSSDKNDLLKLRQDCLKFAGKQNQKVNQDISNNLEENLSKGAFNFIKACFKLNERARPQLSKLILHQFLRIN